MRTLRNPLARLNPLALTFLLACTGHSAEIKEVIVVFKTHFDIGYTDMASNVVSRYRTTMIEDALKVVDQNRALPPEQQFVWTIPGWPAAQILADRPDRPRESLQHIQQAFKEGRFVVHALPFSTHTELLEPEDLVQGLGYSARIARELGQELPRDAKMTDVPCHSWFLPTLLRHAGVDFLHLGCNAASSSPRVPPLFWWEGPDGSRLLTLYSAAGYGTGLVPPREWPYRTWLALIQTGDNHGPPRPDEVEKLLAEAKQKLPGVKVRIGRLSDFSDAILAEKNGSIPVVRGDMPDTWIHGPMCDPAGARIARNLRPAISTSELLHTHLSAWGLSTSTPDTTLSLAREQSLLYGEHTWGGALYWVTGYGKDIKWKYGPQWEAERAAGRFSRLEGSWAEHSAYIERARQLAEPVLSIGLESLAKNVNVRGPRIVVYNPLPWRRDGLVQVRGAKQHGNLKTTDGGPIISTWSEGEILNFVAKELPPSGYRTYQFVPGKEGKTKLRLTAENRTFESPYFKAMIDSSRGTVGSLVDKRTGAELVDNAAAQGFGQFLYERFGGKDVADYLKAYVKIEADWATAELGKPAFPPPGGANYRVEAPSGCRLQFVESRGSITAEMKSAPSPALPFPVTTRLTLYADLPVADFEVVVHDKPAEPLPEAGWFCLPFKLDSPQFRLGRLGGIIDPAKDIVPGANHDLHGIHSGVALIDADGHGVGLCALDNPLMSLDRPGCWKYSTDFTPRKPAVFVNLFNNQWSTNFRLWNSGTWSSRIRLWSFRRYNPDDNLSTPSLETRHPLLAAVAEDRPGSLPSAQTGLALSRKGVDVTALGRNPDGTGLVLRLWEYAGTSGDCTIRLPRGIPAGSIQPVDLRGRPIGTPLSIRNGRFTTQLKAFAPASFQISGKAE